MIAIVALDAFNGIGREGELLAHISTDLKRFKQLTMGKVLIYGRKTLDTFPGRRVLPGRHNIILSSGLQPGEVENAEILSSLEALDARLEQLKNEGYTENDFCLIGGASMYKQLLPRCSHVSVTRIHAIFEADAFFPDLRKAGFELREEGPLLREGSYQFTYEEWELAR